MKKRLRKTGEIVDVIAYSNPYGSIRDDMDCVSYIDSKGTEHHGERGLNLSWDFEDVEEELTKGIDWEERRFELSKSIIAARLSNPDKWSFNENPKDMAVSVVRYADALIAELKKGGCNGSH